MSAQPKDVLSVLVRRLRRGGKEYWERHDELDRALSSRDRHLGTSKRDDYFHELYQLGHLRKGPNGDTLTLAGYRALDGDSDLVALLSAIRRLHDSEGHPPTQISFEEICRDSHYFFPNDNDSPPTWVHFLLIILQLAPENMLSAGPWTLNYEATRIAVECSTVDELLEKTSRAARRSAVRRSELQIREFVGTVVIEALHPTISDCALSRWQAGQFGDAVQSCTNVVAESVFGKTGRRCSEDVPNFFETVFARNDQAFRADSVGAKACGNVRLHLPGDMSETTLKNKQDGLRCLALAFQKGVRNPRAHAATDLAEVEALEILCLASRALRLIDECRRVEVG